MIDVRVLTQNVWLQLPGLIIVCCDDISQWVWNFLHKHGIIYEVLFFLFLDQERSFNFSLTLS